MHAILELLSRHNQAVPQISFWLFVAGSAAAATHWERHIPRILAAFIGACVIAWPVAYWIGCFKTKEASFILPSFNSEKVFLILLCFAMCFVGFAMLAFTCKGTKRILCILMSFLPSLLFAAWVKQTQISAQNDAAFWNHFFDVTTPLPALQTARKHLSPKQRDRISGTLRQHRDYYTSLLAESQHYNPNTPRLNDPNTLDLLEHLGFQIGEQPGLSFAQMERLEKSEALSWQNPAIPKELLLSRWRTLDPHFIRQILQNPSFPSDALSEVRSFSQERAKNLKNELSDIHHKDYYLINEWNNTAAFSDEILIRRQDAPLDELYRIINQTNDQRSMIVLLRSLARNIFTPPDKLEELAMSSDDWVRIGVARNPATPDDLIAKLASDSYQPVRDAAQAERSRRQAINTPPRK